MLVAAGELGSTEPGGILDQYHVEILEQRGLDPELAVMLGWWTAPPARGAGGGEPALVIPYWRGGRIVNRKFRTFAPKKFWQDSAEDGAEKLLWNADCLGDDTLVDQALIITEGELDALAALQAGFRRVVSVPDGAPPKAVGMDDLGPKYDYLKSAYPLLHRDRVAEIIIAADGDDAGANLLLDLSLRLGRARCKYLIYPQVRGLTHRLKDLNEAVQTYTAAAVTQVVMRAQWLQIDGVFRMSELPPLPDRAAYSPGFGGKLDDLYKIRMGDFAVFTGIPSHGKTTFVNDLTCRAVKEHGMHITFASFEQSPVGDHRRSLRSWFGGRHADQQSEAELIAADAWIEKYFSFVAPKDEEDATLDWLIEKLEAAVTRYRANIVVVDPWNELDHQRNRDETTTEYVGRAIKALRRFARVFNIHLIVVAHPTKMPRPGAGDAIQIPNLYDVSDSANWANKADLGVIVHRVDGATLIRTAKSRYHDVIGVPGDCLCSFDYASRRYHPLESKAPTNVQD